MREKKQIGWFVVNTAIERTKGYECAAWYTIVKVEPGRYEAWAEIEDGKVRDFPGVMVTLPGVVVEDNFQSLFCGNAIGRAYDRKQNAGKPDTFNFSPYAHSVAEAILTGRNMILECSWELLEGFTAQQIEFDWKGEIHHTHIIKESGQG